MSLAERLHRLADLLDDDEVFDIVAEMVVQGRDLAPRHSQDRDTGDLLNEVIQRLRDRARSLTSH